jgi:hypothetical protein
MKLLMFNTNTGQVYRGDKLSELILSMPFFSINWKKRCGVLYNKHQTCSFAPEYTNDEMIVEACREALHLLTRDLGWKLYKEYRS